MTLGVEHQRQAEVGLQAALVVLVEDHAADVLQRRVALQLPGEDALRDDLDAGLRADLGVHAHPVADGLADALAEQPGDALRHRARRQAPRLEHDDAPPGQPGRIEQRRRHTRALAGARRRVQHGIGSAGERGKQFRECAGDWQVAQRGRADGMSV